MNLPAVPMALLVAFMWGLQPTVQSKLLKRFDARLIMTIGSLFYMACMAFFVTFNWRVIKKESTKLTWKYMLIIGSVSVLTAFLANIIFLYVLRKHDSYVVSALVYSSPVFTLLLAYFFTDEKITSVGLAGVLLVVAGIACLCFNGNGKSIESFFAWKMDA